MALCDLLAWEQVCEWVGRKPSRPFAVFLSQEVQSAPCRSFGRASPFHLFTAFP